MELITHFIQNQPVESVDGSVFPDVNPFSGQSWASVALADAADVERAVTAARRAFDDGPWPRMSPDERGSHLTALADLIDRHADDLARLDTTDMGKPLAQARGKDVPRAAHNFRFFADYARGVEDESIPTDIDHHIYTRYEPAGVVAAIAPWNFPLMLETWKIAPALAFGDTVVLKPAEQSPASAVRLAELAVDAGFPPGVLNVIQGFGPGSAGEALTSSSGVDLVTFTGESNTGRAILAACAPTLKRVSFEMGGKGANLVFADADLDRAVTWSLRAAFTNAGQVCLAGSRLFVERTVCEEFLARFVAQAEAMKLGDPMDETTEIGPLSSEEHFEKVTSYLRVASDEGAKLLTGGVADDLFVRPTVLTNVDPVMRVCREEIFGPVVTVQPFDSEADAVGMANDSPYGLNAMVFTESLRRAHRVAARLRAGTVWVNCFFVRDLRAPFGGYGDSGIGREGGRFSREFFTEAKAVVIEV
jgi:aminomuconate-semialdehyde/2-hydroxymuconate-6-semialdehyde dehydrogenase